MWVEHDALHFRRGRTTLIVPGEQIRRVEVAGWSLAVGLFGGASSGTVMTVRDRNEEAIAAFGAEIEAVMCDGGRDRRPVGCRSTPEPGGARLALLAPSVVLLHLWVGMAELETRWLMWRRGPSVRASSESVPSSDSESAGSYLVHFHTLDGCDITARPALRGYGTRSATTRRIPRGCWPRPAWSGWVSLWPRSR